MPPFPHPVHAGDIICADIDSTIADTRHRRELCPAVHPERTWDEYAAACGGDTPITGVVTFLQIAYTAGFRIHLMTNRPESARQDTIDWLYTCWVPFHQLHMRAPGQPFDSADVKLDYVKGLRSAGQRVALCIEDWPDTAQALEDAGFTVLCVNPRYDSRPLHTGPATR